MSYISENHLEISLHFSKKSFRTSFEDPSEIFRGVPLENLPWVACLRTLSDISLIFFFKEHYRECLINSSKDSITKSPRNFIRSSSRGSFPLVNSLQKFLLEFLYKFSHGLLPKLLHVFQKLLLRNSFNNLFLLRCFQWFLYKTSH